MKTIAPSAIVALQEALTNLYWYKSDLKRHMLNIFDPKHLRYVDWNENKRRIIDSAFQGLDLSSKVDKSIVARMIVDISQITNLSHLQRLEDGNLKVSKAREAIQRLASLARAAEEIIKETGEWEKSSVPEPGMSSWRKKDPKDPMKGLGWGRPCDWPVRFGTARGPGGS